MAILLIAFRNLFGEKGRLIITIGGVAFSVTLILVLLGLYQGWNRQMTKFLGKIDTSFWVGQKGTENLSHTLSILPAGMEAQLESVRAVDLVQPFIGRQISFKIDGEEAHLFLVGTSPDNPIEPYKVASGSSQPDFGEIIIDEAFAKEKKLSLSDTITINNKDFIISGFSKGGNLLVYTYALAQMADLREILDFEMLNNYYLVKSTNPDLTEASINAEFPDLEIIPKETFLKNNADLVKETFLPIVGILLLVAVAIGIAVIGLTIFTATLEKSREYGLLKAIGFANYHLYFVSLLQSLAAGVLGFIFGWILTQGVVFLAVELVSGFIYEIIFKELTLVFLVTLAMSALASLIPLRRLVKIDPATVFKA